MVKIINGEIVPDDDPRAVAWQRRQEQSRRPQNTQYGGNPQYGGNQQYGGSNPQYGSQMQGQEQSPLVEINRRLREFGIPNLTLGGHVLEPAIIIALLLALIFIGLKGVLIVGGLYYFFVLRPQQQNQQLAGIR